MYVGLSYTGGCWYYVPENADVAVVHKPGGLFDVDSLVRMINYQGIFSKHSSGAQDLNPLLFANYM